MKKLSILLCLVFAAIWTVIAAGNIVTPNKIIIPDIEGYKTLKGDFHIHTVFSDGNVWPTTRVQEAIWEGLDVIAITEHIDTRHQKMVKNGYFNPEKCDRDASYEIARKAAGKKLLVVHGGEITRGMPPGHWNCLFVKDNDDICMAAEANDHDHVLAMEGGLKEARKQGAFIMWNHPNWEKQAPNETIMHEAHKKFLKEGYMDAIEIYNTGYCPEAHEWALEHNLTMLGNSDAHGPFFYTIDYLHGAHRPVTLVFAKEKTLEGVREALDNARTAVFAEGRVYGREQELSQLIKACLKIKKKLTAKGADITFENKSSIPITLTKAPGSENYRYDRVLTIPPFSSTSIRAQLLIDANNKQPKLDDSVKEVEVNFYVENFQIGADKPLPFKIIATRK